MIVFPPNKYLVVVRVSLCVEANSADEAGDLASNAIHSIDNSETSYVDLEIDSITEEDLSGEYLG